MSFADLKSAQRICDGLDSAKIDDYFRKWLRLILERLLSNVFAPRFPAAYLRQILCQRQVGLCLVSS